MAIDSGVAAGYHTAMITNPTAVPSARRKAAEEGAIVYRGSPCPKCNSRQRYVLSGRCRACQTATAKAARISLRELRAAARKEQQP